MMGEPSRFTEEEMCTSSPWDAGVGVGKGVTLGEDFAPESGPRVPSE